VRIAYFLRRRGREQNFVRFCRNRIIAGERMKKNCQELNPRIQRKLPAIAVSDERGVRSLHVGGEAIQSSMKIGDPFALALDYTRCMMAFLLFHPEPRHALMIGLGGGSLAKFFFKHLRRTRVRVVELDPRIVATARAHFALPPDHARLAVEIGDGAEALAPECCDVLVVDAYHDEAHVPELATAEFYDAAFLALEPRGALVVNFMDDDPRFDQYMRRLESAFGGAVLAMRALYDPNIVAFGLKGLPPSLEWEELRRRAEGLESRLGLPFSRYVKRLRSMNRSSGASLLLAG
jgi:spermidine synthase